MQRTWLHQKLVFPINPRKKIGQYTQFPTSHLFNSRRGLQGPWLITQNTTPSKCRENLSGESRSLITGWKTEPCQSPCRGKEVLKTLSKDKNEKTDHFTGEKSQSDLGRKSEALDFWASTSRQTLEPCSSCSGHCSSAPDLCSVYV